MKIEITTINTLIKLKKLFPNGNVKTIGNKSYWLFRDIKK